jgi:hypothetical protein
MKMHYLQRALSLSCHLLGRRFFEKNSENGKVKTNGTQELSNEWSCQYVSTILNILGNFCFPALVTESDKLGQSTGHCDFI